MKETLAITKALADENRLRIIMMLMEGEKCVCQIVQILGNAPSTVSKHLSILRRANLIDSYKDGRWIYYFLPERPNSVITDALYWVKVALRNCELIRQDQVQGTIVCGQDPEDLTRMQRGNAL